MAENINSLYPQPQTPQPGLMTGDPSHLIGMFGQMQQIQGRQAMGEAWRNALQPDGSIDHATLMRGAANAGVMAPDAVTAAQSQLQQRIQNQASQFELQANQNKFVMDSIGTLADKPNVTDEDLRNFVVRTARNTGIPSGMLNSWMRSLPSDPAGRKQALVTLRNMAMGSAAASTPDEGAPDQTTGAPVSVTRGQAGYQRAGVAGGAPGAGAPVATRPGIVGLPPGFKESATGLAAGGVAGANALMAANDSSMSRKGMLGNLEEDLNHFTAGPSADWTKVAKAWVNRNVPMPSHWQFDPKSIASQEQFAKQAAQLAQAQFQSIGGTGTDSQFNSAFATSPNETLSQLGNKGIIRLLKGNEDAIQAKSRAWQNWLSGGNGPQTYPQFNQQFNDKFDPRVFQFKYIPQKERQEYINRMDPADRQRFWADLTYAHKVGWIPYDVPVR